MRVGVHGQRVQQLPVLQHPRVQQAARLGDQLRDVFCQGKGKRVSRTCEGSSTRWWLISTLWAAVCNPAEIPLGRTG